MTANDDKEALANLVVELERMTKLFEDHDRAQAAELARMLLGQLKDKKDEKRSTNVDSAS